MKEVARENAQKIAENQASFDAPALHPELERVNVLLTDAGMAAADRVLTDQDGWLFQKLDRYE